MKLYVEFKKGEDGYIIASCPALKGCYSQGKTIDEARQNISEAIELWLDTANDITNEPDSIYEEMEV